MSNWTARLKIAISQMEGGGTAITDETPFVSVLSVPPGAVYHLPDRLSSVSSVGVWAVFENTPLTAALIAAAMKVCDRHGDGEAARADMRQQCLELPPRLQADLLEHFQGKATNNDHFKGPHMNIFKRTCANCAAFNPVPVDNEPTCWNLVTIIERAGNLPDIRRPPSTGDCCDSHLTAAEDRAETHAIQAIEHTRQTT